MGARTLYQWCGRRGLGSCRRRAGHETGNTGYAEGRGRGLAEKAGIGFDVNFMGLGQNVIVPHDGKPVNLFRDQTMYPSMLNELQNGFLVIIYKVKLPYGNFYAVS